MRAITSRELEALRSSPILWVSEIFKAIEYADFDNAPYVDALCKYRKDLHGASLIDDSENGDLLEGIIPEGINYPFDFVRRFVASKIPTDNS